MMPADFWKDMNLPENSDIHKLEARFLEIVKERIQTVAETYDETEVAAEETWLRAFHQNFFLAVLNWVSAEAKKEGRKANHPEALKLKKKAKKVIQDLQNNIIEFATVYMHLNRYVTLLRDEIRKEETKLGSSAAKDMKWTSDAGIAIRRYKKRKKQIIKDHERFETIRPSLEEMNENLSELESALADLQNTEYASKTIRAVISSLRTGNYNRIKKIIAEIRGQKKKFGADQATFKKRKSRAVALARKITDTVREHETLLKTPEGKVYLRPLEIDMIIKSHAQEMKKIRSYLLKYHLPYMQYKVDTLFHLKDKLLVVGSLDSLMTLYKKLIIGLAEPIPDIKGVRQYESEVLERITYLLETQFREVPKIKKRAEETVREFRQSTEEIKRLKEEVSHGEIPESGSKDSGDTASAAESA